LWTENAVLSIAVLSDRSVSLFETGRGGKSREERRGEERRETYDGFIR